MEQYIIAAIITIIIGFFSVYALTPIVIKALEKRNVTVIDVNKKEKTLVARPGGLSIIVGVISSLIALYFFFPVVEILAIAITSGLAFLVGIIDDRKTMAMEQRCYDEKVKSSPGAGALQKKIKC